MGNLIRLKQVDNPEFSGYVQEIGNNLYYSVSNPSGFISSVNQDSDFLQLSVDVSTISGDLVSSIASTGETLTLDLSSTGSTLDTKIDNLSGYLEVSNTNIETISGNVNTAQNVSTGYAYNIGTDLSGDITSLSGYVVSSDSSLSSQISSLDSSLTARVSSLEGVFVASGSNFVDINSNNQTVLGQKSFDSRVDFKLINTTPVTGDYSNPGGQNAYIYTQFTDDDLFFASGLGYVTGDLFVTKIVYPNDEECIISSNYYTGTY